MDLIAATNHGAKKGAKLLRRIASMLSFKPLVYGYANARVHGLYSRFLTKEQLHYLMAAPSTDAMIELLERTAYREDLVALSLHFKGDDLIELAVSRHFGRFSRLLLSFSPKEALPLLNALLGRWDSHNLKVVLLARKQKKPFEQILPYLVIAGSIDESMLRAIHSAKNGEEILHLLRISPGGRALLELEGKTGMHSTDRLRNLIRNIDSAESLQPLLDELYRLSYIFAAHACDGIYGEDIDEISTLLRMRADEKNLSTILRLRMIGITKGLQVKNYLVPGGSIPTWQWIEIAQNGIETTAVERLAFRYKWGKAIKQYLQDSSLPNLEAQLEQISAIAGVRAFRHSQLSAGVLAGALLLKEEEISNIRKIVRAKAYGLREEEIEKMLVLVR